MAVAPADLIQPVGPIDPSLFPTLDPTGLADYVQAYITDGEARHADVPLSERDALVRPWACYRAFSAAYVRLNAEAASVTFAGDGSGSRLASQINNIGALAAAYLAEYQTALAVVEPQPVGVIAAATSFRTVSFAW